MYKKQNANIIISKLFVVLLLIGIVSVFLSNDRYFFYPATENPAKENNSINFSLEDIFEDEIKTIVFFFNRLINYYKNDLIFLVYLPITFYFIGHLIKSNRTPRLPPA